MNTHSQYLVASGALTGVQIQGTPEILAINTPAGCAWVQGSHDPRRAEVRLVTNDLGDQVPVVDALTPTRPADSDYQTWTWSEAAGDWVAVATLLLLQARACEPVRVLLAQLDAKQARPVGEIAVAQALGEAAPAEAVERLQAINADKAALRSHMSQIDQCTSYAELQALLATPPLLQAMEQ